MGKVSGMAPPLKPRLVLLHRGKSEDEAFVLYTGGECPVCSFMHDIGLVKNPSTGLLFFFCASCGCCFLKPPVVTELGEIVLPETYSLGGFAFPTAADVVEATARGWKLDGMDDYPGSGSYWDRTFQGFLENGLPVRPY